MLSIITFLYMCIIYFIIFITNCSYSSLIPTHPIPLLTQSFYRFMSFICVGVNQEVKLGLTIEAGRIYYLQDSE